MRLRRARRSPGNRAPHLKRINRVRLPRRESLIRRQEIGPTSFRSFSSPRQSSRKLKRGKADRGRFKKSGLAGQRHRGRLRLNQPRLLVLEVAEACQLSQSLSRLRAGRSQPRARPQRKLDQPLRRSSHQPRFKPRAVQLEVPVVRQRPLSQTPRPSPAEVPHQAGPRLLSLMS